MDDIPELIAFVAESQAIARTLHGIGAAAWSGPGLGEWNLHELAAHVVGAAARLAEYAEQPVDGDEAACDRVGYWRMDLEAAAPAVAARARERARLTPPSTLPSAFDAAWRASAATVAAGPPAALVATLRGPMRTDEYLATRVVELCIHHIDLRAALDLPPTSSPEAARLTLAVLEALLGGPRPRNLGRTRFLLVATGRLPSDDARFPLLR